MIRKPTIEWFGTTTYRLRAGGLTLFLDTWLERPSVLKKYLNIDDVQEADYIFISHAHFDHLPGADRLAKRTGARIVGTSETIRIMREAGVPEDQLISVHGGERLPLFSKNVLNQAEKGTCKLLPAPPGAPPRPHWTLAAMSVDVWPSLHCLPPTHHPKTMDTGEVFGPEENPFKSSLDITYGMKNILLKMDEFLPAEAIDDGWKSFLEYTRDPKNKFSTCDGGQLMYNFRFGGKAVLWSAHLGAYEGIMRRVEPKPDVAILGAAGQPNHDGRPFEGSAAQFLRMECEWLDHPEKVVWCLHDESPIPPYSCDTTAATKTVEAETKSKVWDLEPAKPYILFE